MKWCVLYDKSTVLDVADLPAFEIPRSLHVKSGPLTYYKKTDRWFFKREHYIKVFGAVFEEHLLIYKTERSEKPLFCLNLLTYKAHELNNSKKCGAFEVTNRIQNFNVCKEKLTLLLFLSCF